MYIYIYVYIYIYIYIYVYICICICIYIFIYRRRGVVRPPRPASFNRLLRAEQGTARKASANA